VLVIVKFKLQEGFTDVLRMEMRKFGIKVITVEPGNFSASTAMLNKSKVCIKS
jgi:NAD(P)-dependent dehydrogenase (short-subunit alcohol dehydrogenase family)